MKATTCLASAGAVGFVGMGQVVGIAGAYDVTVRTYAVGDPASHSTVSTRPVSMSFAAPPSSRRTAPDTPTCTRWPCIPPDKARRR